MVENVRAAHNGHPAPFGRERVSALHRPDERILGRLIAAIGSSPQAAMPATTLVDSLVTLEGCGAALVYQWDPDLERLVLRAVAPQEHGPCAEEYALGEGVIGRAALRRDRPVIGTFRADGPSRTTIGPSRTALGLRVAARGGELLGVVALVASGAGPFAAATVRLATDAAGLFALALEHERMEATARLHEELLGSIDLLARAASSDTPLGEVLEGVAALGQRGLRLSACAIFVDDRGHEAARLAAVAPRDAELPSSWRGGLRREQVRSAEGGRLLAPNSAVALRTGAECGHAILLAPATLGSERFGTLALVDRATRSFSGADLALAERLSRVVALALRQRRLVDGSLERTRAEDLLWDIVGPSSSDPAAVLARAQRLGCDLAERHVVIVGSAPTRHPAPALRATLHALDRSAISDVSSGRVTAIVSAVAVAGLTSAGWSVGVSQPCDGLARYPLAYRQAQEAHDLGRRLFGSGRVVRFEDLGGYRFVPALLECGLANEAEYQQVSRLPDELLKTLEAYLDSGGNTAQAANQLFLHRNTLRQRLDRISTLLDLDLSVPSRWLSLQLVIKTARLARIAAEPTADSAPHAG